MNRRDPKKKPSGPPRYLQIAAQLQTGILRGNYSPGKQLPPEKKLATQFDVAHMTVRHALDELVRRRLIVRAHGRGTFVAPRPEPQAPSRPCIMVVGPRKDVQVFFKDSYYSALMGGAGAELSRRGYDLMITMKHDYTYLDLFRRHPFVKGLLIAGFHAHLKAELNELIRRHVAFVLMGRSLDAPLVNYIDADHEMAGYLATAHLLKHGCQRIAFAAHEPEENITARRLTGYRKALRDRGVTFNKWLVSFLDKDPVLYRKQFSNLLAAPRPSDGLILSFQEKTKPDLIRLIARSGLSVPGNLPFVGFHNFSGIFSRCGLPCAYIKYPLEQVGQQATDALIRLIAGRTPRQVNRRLPVKLVVCRTAGR